MDSGSSHKQCKNDGYKRSAPYYRGHGSRVSVAA